jgi:hypothetical protein
MTGVKINGQALATVLSVYATNQTLDSTAAAAHYGFNASGTVLGTDTVNVGSSGDAFGAEPSQKVWRWRIGRSSFLYPALFKRG